jgi:SagB-type dehydrogenase family enzyme
MTVSDPIHWQLTGKPSLFSVSEIFHENSKIHKGVSSFIISAEAIHAMSEGYKSYHFGPSIPLPMCDDPGSTSLSSCIKGRSSVRQYSQQPFSIDQLSAMLRYSSAESVPGRRRPAPSAGALFPLEIYPICLNVNGIDRDAYHYNVRAHSLEPLCRSEHIEQIREALFVPEIGQSAAVIFVITAVFGRTKIKYGERGYRFILLEAGHVAQNICLTATAMSTGACPIGGYVDDTVNDILNVDGVEEAAIYLISAGCV